MQSLWGCAYEMRSLADVMVCIHLFTLFIIIIINLYGQQPYILHLVFTPTWTTIIYNNPVCCINKIDVSERFS
jgi:hypothetical protein